MTGVTVWPGYAVLRLVGWLNVRTALLGGTIMGAVTVSLCWHGLIGQTLIE